MEAVRSTPITRSWPRTLTLFSLGILGMVFGALSLAGGIHDIDPRFLFLGVMFLLLGFAGAYMGVKMSYVGDCPACGTPQKGLGDLHRCDNCLIYGDVVDGRYCELEPDRILKKPLLSARVSQQSQMPKLCSACGLSASGTQRLKIIRIEFAFDLDVPHCELHPAGGADLTTAGPKKKGRAEIPVLKVASYRFYREFLKLNNMGLR